MLFIIIILTGIKNMATALVLQNEMFQMKSVIVYTYIKYNNHVATLTSRLYNCLIHSQAWFSDNAQSL